jgi:hypothetical protein
LLSLEELVESRLDLSFQREELGNEIEKRDFHFYG